MTVIVEALAVRTVVTVAVDVPNELFVVVIVEAAAGTVVVTVPTELDVTVITLVTGSALTVTVLSGRDVGGGADMTGGWNVAGWAQASGHSCWQ